MNPNLLILKMGKVPLEEPNLDLRAKPRVNFALEYLLVVHFVVCFYLELAEISVSWPEYTVESALYLAKNHRPQSD